MIWDDIPMTNMEFEIKIDVGRSIPDIVHFYYSDWAQSWHAWGASNGDFNYRAAVQILNLMSEDSFAGLMPKEYLLHTLDIQEWVDG
jgi:hypothetical protein